MNESLRAWLALSLAPGIDAATWRRLRNHNPNAHQLERMLVHALAGDDTLACRTSLLGPAQLQALRHPDTLTRADQALEWQARSPDHRLISPGNPEYPAPLAAITDPPRMLYGRGRIDALAAPHIAIIGARKATRSGCNLAFELAADLSAAGLHVVSGLALGIDAAAHQGCLDAGGLTVAFAATPVDRVYPRAHAALASRIVEQGLILSEFPFGTQLQRHCFPRRNRLISGLCPGVVVIEAALPSGSLTTAMHALKQGREVMAVPGSPARAESRGCHALIRDGATLVENRDQILECLQKELQENLLSGSRTSKTPVEKPVIGNKTVDTIELTLLNQLAHDQLTPDELVIRLGWPLHRVLAKLAALEVSGHLNRERGGRYARCAP